MTKHRAIKFKRTEALGIEKSTKIVVQLFQPYFLAGFVHVAALYKMSYDFVTFLLFLFFFFALRF